MIPSRIRYTLAGYPQLPGPLWPCPGCVSLGCSIVVTVVITIILPASHQSVPFFLRFPIRARPGRLSHAVQRQTILRSPLPSECNFLCILCAGLEWILLVAGLAWAQEDSPLQVGRRYPSYTNPTSLVPTTQPHSPLLHLTLRRALHPTASTVHTTSTSSYSRLYARSHTSQDTVEGFGRI